ncbi:MAG: M23 family metallopeptidase [Treponema sp.]|jgi:murein DD-endopeptidase MepM/ murein hydrolase activator NlpD|nr:M23 family metallopeptidase [Treponema sp.]
MASIHEYKRFENSIVQKVKNLILFIAKGILRCITVLFQVFTRRYTIVLVPHSAQKVYNLHFTFASFFCSILVLAGGVAGVFFWYGTSYNTTKGSFTSKDNRLQDTQASLDQLRDETALLLREAKGFETALSGTLSSLGSDIAGRNNPTPGGGDLSSFFDITETPDGILHEVYDVRQLTGYLSSAVEPVKEIGTLLNSQSALFTEIPSIWPIKGGLGHISMFFGQNENPFTGQYYIHKGIDLSTYRQGDPIVATADGQVVTVDYEHSGFGNNVIIKHKHGFYTRYAHLLTIRVKTGQRVQQGEVIGYIGNTGLSTGPHLHYEVHIGSDVVDPYKYINIRSNLSRSH